MASMDFFGFSFNGHHSSDLGIVRVSDGSRYNDTILPSFQDKTISIPGGDGTYFFGSNYTNRPFTVSIAFDGLKEAQFRKLRQVFNGKDVGDLIFDEAPYKAYTVKVQSPPQLKYICFDMEVEDQSTTSTILHNHDLYTHSSASAYTAPTSPGRVYKGEGTIQFIGYKPFAHSVYKYLNLYEDTNKNEWATASGMLATKGTYDGENSTSIKVYNCGDVETDFCAYYSVTTTATNITLTLNTKNGTTVGQLALVGVEKEEDSTDSYIRINTKTNLVEGCDSSFQLTGTLYNQYITGGDFFKIPVCEDTTDYYTLNSSISCKKVEYDYLYY